MSVVIIGGHDRMVCQYKQICRQHKCKVKVFTQMPSVSHKMVKCAVAAAKNKKIEIVRSHTSSQAALKEILEEKRR